MAANWLLPDEENARAEAAYARFPEDLAMAPDLWRHEMRLTALARRHRLTAHDAAYLELAEREAIPLATLDDALARAARAEHIPIIGDNG